MVHTEATLTFKKLAQAIEAAAKDVREMQETPQPAAGQSSEEVHAVSKKTEFVCYRCGQTCHSQPTVHFILLSVIHVGNWVISKNLSV